MRPDRRLLFLVPLLLTLLGGLATPWLEPELTVGTPWTGPSAQHLLGLDALGRDVLSGMVVGGWKLLLVCLATGLACSVLGTAVALVAWRHRRLAGALQAVTGLALAMPAVVVVSLAAVFLEPLTAVAVVMLTLGTPLSARTVSAALVSVRRSGYVTAALLRAEPARIVLVREVLSGVRSVVAADAGLRVVAAMHLCVAVQIIAPGEGTDWATMIPAGLSGISLNPWATLAPAVAVAVVGGCIALALGGTALRSRPDRVDRSRPDASPDGPLLQVTDLEVRAVDGTSLTRVDELVADRGDAVVIAGPSGCGKTTALRALAGLLPAGADRAGVVRVGGEVTYVAQDPAGTLDPLRTVEWSVRDGRRGVGRADVVAALDRLGLGEELLDRLPTRLSGGQATRVALARAFLRPAPVVLLDEPTSGLDRTNRDHVLDAVEQLVQQGHLVVAVSHDDQVAQRLDARVVRLGDTDSTGAARRAAVATTDALLSARGVRVAHGARVVLDRVDLDLHRGRIVALTGPSGAGKSTLLRALGGLVRAEGDLTLDGAPLAVDGWAWRPVRDHDQRRLVQLAAQDSRDELNPGHTLREQVLRAARHWHVDGEAERATDDVLARLGLSQEVAARPAARCSGGQRQRAVLARALVAAPDVLLADEPTAALDAAARDLVLAELDRAAHRGCAVLVATHDEHVVERADAELTVGDAEVIGRGARTP